MTQKKLYSNFTCNKILSLLIHIHVKLNHYKNTYTNNEYIYFYNDTMLHVGELIMMINHYM